MRLLNADVDTTVIALWMGHENVATTQVYIHADLALKERAIARTAPQDTPPVATSHPMPCSPSSTDCNYAAHPQPGTLPTAHRPTHVGITGGSA
jgi:hypothetical protein